MFNETTSLLGDLGTDTDRSWYLLGYPNKTAWKAAGKPRYMAPGAKLPKPLPGTQVPGPIGSDGIPIDQEVGGAGGPVVPAADGASGTSGTSGSFLSGSVGGIPILYLIIGAGLLLVMKK